jgi:hypothetical protein
MAKNRIRVELKCDDSETIKILTIISKLKAEILNYSVDGVEPEKKVGF